MSAAYQSTQSAVATSSPLVITKPVSLTAGDTMIANIGAVTGDASVGTVTPPAGWTIVASVTQNGTGSFQNGFVFYKVATQADADATNFTFTAVASVSALNGSISRINGSHALTPINVSSSNTGTGTSLTTGAITPTKTSSLLLIVESAWRSASNVEAASAYAVTNNNPSWTEAYDIAQSIAAGGQANHIAMAYGSYSPATTTGGASMTLSQASAAYFMVLLAIVPIPDTADRYWVGGTGTWDLSSTTHWSATSGGAGGASYPEYNTANVYLDGSSGGGTVTVGASITIVNLIATGFTGTVTQSSALTLTGNMTLGAAMTYTVGAAFTIAGDLTFGSGTTFAGSSAISLAGDLTLTSGCTLTYTGTITFSSTLIRKNITTAGKTILSSLVFDGVGGGWTLQDSLTCTGTSITLTNGSLTLGNYNVSVPLFSSTNSNTRSLIMGTGTVTLTGTGTVWNCATSTNMTLTRSTSTIKLTNASVSTKTFSGGSLIYYNLWITGSGSGAYTIVGSNTFNDFKVDTPPHTVNFTATSIQRLKTFTVNGTAGNLMTLQSTSSGTPWYIYKTGSGDVVCDYLSLQDSYISYHN